MKVPFVDLGRLHASIREEIDDAIARVVDNSAFVGGKEVSAFEDAFAAAHQAPAAAGCGSGTDALALTLRALGIGPGDEVVVPSMTFVATAEAVFHVGATPVLADVEPVTLLLTEATVEAVRTDRTRAVMPVHLFGHVVDFALIDTWRSQGLLVVEDAAQAHLATSGGAFVGTRSNAACFSFYPGKNLGAFGDGGAVISQDEGLVAEVRRLRDHGRTSKYLHEVPGWCSRLDGLQAAILRTKLAHLPDWTEGRRRVAANYAEHVDPELLVPWTDGAVHHLLAVQLDHRDEVKQTLGDAGVSTGIHYPYALTRMPWLAADAAPTPSAERAGDHLLSLPMDPLMSEAEVGYVSSQLVKAIDARG